MTQERANRTPALPHLFSPLRIGPVTIKNRIVSTGHDTGMARDGHVSDQLIAYQQARAKGGAGLIVVQVAAVHATARYTAKVLLVTDDSCIPGYRSLSDAAHQHGAKLFGQLFHPGRQIKETRNGVRIAAVAPSAVPNERGKVMPRALADDEIQEIIQGYGAAAERLVRAGLDGVEFVASHGYLPSQFLNAETNRRSGRYGGGYENRLRFTCECLEQIRGSVGGDAAVGMRISL